MDASTSHVCAIDGSGDLRCWGNGSSGKLGYGSTTSVGDNETPGSVEPVDLGPGRSALEVAAGTNHTCAILDNHSVRCWGLGARLGYGASPNIGDDESPASAGPLTFEFARTAVAIAAGANHTCAILDNGTVRCWGENFFGQLGYGNTSTVLSPAIVGPVDLGAGRTAVAITAGDRHTCALLDNGTVRCWGDTPGGLIGDNETPGSVPPVDFGLGRTVVAITAGEYHTCAILEDGTVRCWGNGGQGRLGYGNTSAVTSPASVGAVDLGAGRTAVAITAGEYHTCALLDNGSLRCWGWGVVGQTGYGDTTDIGDDETPGSVGPVNVGAGRNAVGIAAGGFFTCVRLDNGAIRCWGSGSQGQLGYGNTATIGDNETPGSVGTVDVGTGFGALEVSAGVSHSCALFSNGTVRCWGSGADGRLGYAGTQSIGDDENPGVAGPVDLGGRSAVEIGTGDNFTCALLDDGTVRCWGKGDKGQLGSGGTASIGDNETPALAAVDLGGKTALGISAGGTHACAVLSDGTVRCWGEGSNGRLGYGNTTTIGDNEAPGSAGPVSLGAGRAAVAVSAGGSHTCVQLSNGGMICWGSGSSGQLGYGDTTDIGDDETPGGAGLVNVGGSVGSIAAGANHTCAILSVGTGRCWGLNSDGQLGYGNTNNIGDNETPNTAGTITMGFWGTGVRATAGGSHTCTISNEVLLRCWGLNSSGQLGNANTTTIGDDEVPVYVVYVDLGEGLSGVEVSAGKSHTCAVVSNGTVRCWGLNANGQLGYGHTNNIGDDETPGSAGPLDFVDDMPTAANDSASLAEDAPAASIDVLANDADPDGGPKSVVAKSEGSHGSVAIAGGGSSLTYTPVANYCGPDSFTYTLNGGSTATVSVTVTCVDDPPLAAGDVATLAEDATATAIDVLANDTDVDGGAAKSIAGASDPAHGAVALTGGTPGAHTGLTYAPDPDYCGPDSFTYELNGGSTATVSITVNCVDDPPQAQDDSAAIVEDAAATPISVLANDTDVDSGPKAIASKANGSHGIVTVTGAGAGLSYQPDPNYCGPDAFTYTLNGGSTASVTIEVSCVDDAPVAANDSFALAEDSAPTSIDVLANDTDVDGGPKAVAGQTNGSHGTAAPLAGGAGLAYKPDPDYCGPDSLTYTLNGGSSATVFINVTCVDEPVPPVDEGPQQGGGGAAQGAPSPGGQSGPVVNVTPGVGVVSGRRHPRIAIKGAYAFFTLTCRLTDRDCAGVVTIDATVPSISLGPTMEKVTLVKGKFRIGPGRSVLVRAKLTKRGLEILEAKRTLRGVASKMTIADAGNGERGEIVVNLVRRPKASLLPGGSER